MKDLPSRVRGKAILIANALLEAGHAESRAIRIAVARAREWGRRSGLMDPGGPGA
jgi:uncharacterized protein YdaT